MNRVKVSEFSVFVVLFERVRLATATNWNYS